MSSRYVRTCDRCGTEDDPAWYRLQADALNLQSVQPVPDIDLCGLCYSVYREFVKRRLS